MLASARLGDEPRFAQPARKQALAKDVVDLVRAGVGQVLAFQVDAHVGVDRGRQPLGAVQRRRPSGKAGLELAQLGPEGRVVANLVVGLLELEQG